MELGWCLPDPAGASLRAALVGSMVIWVALAFGPGCAAPTRELVDDSEFARRSEFQLASPIVTADPSGRVFPESVEVRLALGLEGASLHYTLDGSLPNEESPRYEHPLVLRESVVLHGMATAPGFEASDVVRREFRKCGLRVQRVQTQPEPSPPYAGQGPNTISDGIGGSEDFRDGRWLGYQERVIVTLDLGEERSITELAIGCRQDPAAWIFSPARAIVKTSLDGITFHPWVSAGADPEKPPQEATRLFFLALDGPQRRARWVSFELTPLHPLPRSHPGYPDGRGWIFLDEILVY